MKNHFLVLLLITSSSLSIAKNSELTREERELLVAEQGVLSSLLRAKSNVPYSSIYDMGPNKAELGLALIGARSTSPSLKSLSHLIRFRMDGALSEDYSCYALEKGKGLIRYLNNINAKKLLANCHEEVQREISNLPTFNNLDINSICKSESQIQKEVRDLTKELAKGTKCDPGDF